ncbi:MAG: hypothetical protein NTU85_00525 [Candidatus Kaiserbacteria bacterium]|nr:hypothetical protein [Candidatus Kaiserbacteria bacterium]
MDLTKLEIVKIPAGPAPEWVRKEWVGVKLTGRPISPVSVERDFTSGKFIGNRGGWSVEVASALEALSKKSALATEWFHRNIPEGMTRFSFGPDELKPI